MRYFLQIRKSAVAAFAAIAIAAFCCGAARAQSASLLMGNKAPANAVWLDTMLDEAGERPPGGAIAREAFYGGPILLGRMVYPHGITFNGDGSLVVGLDGAVKTFAAMVGVNDDQPNKGSVVFRVLLDGKEVKKTPVMSGGMKPVFIKIDTTGAKLLVLVTDSNGDGMNNDIAAWGGAMLVLDPAAALPPTLYGIDDEKAAAAAISHPESPAPSINGPRITGGTPGYPFLFKIPVTGQGPMKFSAKNLPAGLALDPKTGIISGLIKKAGTYKVDLSVRGPKGTANRRLTIVGGKGKIALTPPMGWNSWNVWADSVDENKVLAAADAMMKSGLAAHGYQYVNIDEGWQAGRGADGIVIPAQKIPDIKKLADYMHANGLKLGIYSSPGTRTCGRPFYEGSYRHETEDALTYAKWGVDYLKHDWCSYEAIAKDHSLPELQKPYLVMRGALDKAPRDIVYSLCQYGMGDVWEWGAQVGGNLWRTVDDITDCWGSLNAIAFSQSGHEKFAGPGHWNDPDMLVVGKVGWGPSVRGTRLSKNEQILHITMWSMLAAPLLIGADLSQLDRFTLDLLTNDEVLAVDQDPLGKQAWRVAQNGDGGEVWVRPLWDGTMAAALVNRGFVKGPVTVKWADLGMKGKQPVRDLWRRRRIGTFDGSFTVDVPSHGAVMLKIGTPVKSAL